MKISTQEEYDKIPDGANLKVVLEGDSWDEDCGNSVDVLKMGNKLYDSPRTYYDFTEKDYKDYEFSIILTPLDKKLGGITYDVKVW